MKLGPVTKSEKRNKTALKKFDDGVTSENFHCHFLNFLPIRKCLEAGFRTQSLQKLCFQ